MSTGVEITDDDGPGGSHKRGTWAWYRGVGGACGHLESSCHFWNTFKSNMRQNKTSVTGLGVGRGGRYEFRTSALHYPPPSTNCVTG